MNEKLLQAKEKTPLDETNEGYYPSLFFILRQDLKVQFKTSLKMILSEIRGSSKTIEYQNILNLFDGGGEAPPEMSIMIKVVHDLVDNLKDLPQPRSNLMNIIWLECMFPPFNSVKEFQERLEKAKRVIVNPGKE